MTTAVAHIWKNNTIIKQTRAQTMNIIFVEAELMAIHSGLISTMEKQNVHEIIVITDSIIVAKKIFKSHIGPF